ncbi:hypothetical protein CYLTODRAFT_417509 [Cylindrobasidium torrendii FP15055 ss-10]|uniref:EF-hand n=1 Tax=Cylindrobasidium torrendii FP15055 ss-10 TaxID=1314674 RepID=A0A0D7BS46_9AGAR|nr:hypothetical protein CYLTODRAFT_417509 [Cylindrobasidium torrendii FP15055 ss-10]
MTSSEESRLVDVILGSRESLPAADAINAFLPSRLPPEVLAHVWEMTESDQKGYLSRDEVLRSLRLLGWAQRGFALEEGLADEPSPLVTLDGQESPPLPVPTFFIAPSLSPTNRAKYEALFHRTGPEDGLLDGRKIWATMLKSNLSLDKLTHIWDLVDAQRAAKLNCTEFCLIMYFIHGLLDGYIKALPSSIPPHLYQEAEQTFVEKIDFPVPSTPSTTLVHAFTTDFHFIRASVDLDSWTIPEVVKQHSDSYFTALDKDASNMLHGDEVVPFLVDSGLPPEELARIWDLCDTGYKGYLVPDEFARSVFLVYKELAGYQVPMVLPPIHSSVQCGLLPEPQPRSRRQTLSDVEKPLLNKRWSELPPLPQTPSPASAPSPDVSDELDELKLKLEHMSQLRMKEKSTLNDHIAELQQSQQELLTENSELRIGMRNASHSMRRSMTVHTDKSNSLAAENARLKQQLREADTARENLREMHTRAMVEVTQENQLLHAKAESLASAMTSTAEERDVQRLVIEEMTAEIDRLRMQVADLRDTATLLPSAGDDEDLQRQINEDIARENRKLRSQVGELAESLRSLQASYATMVSRDDFERERQEGRQRVAQAEGQRADLQRRMDAAIQDNHRLRASRTATEVRGTERDLPPPAYEAVAPGT